MGLGPTPALGREGWRSRGPETASPSSARRPVHQGADPPCLDRVGLSAPRGWSPRRDGIPVPLLPVPIGEPLGPGRHFQGLAGVPGLCPTWPPWGRAGRVAGRGPGAGLQAGGLRPGSPGAGGRAGSSAVVRADPVVVVAPGLPAPRQIPPSSVGVLAVGRLGTVGGVRAGVGRLGRSRPLPVLRLPRPGRIATGRPGLRRPTSRPVSDRLDPRPGEPTRPDHQAGAGSKRGDRGGTG